MKKKFLAIVFSVFILSCKNLSRVTEVPVAFTLTGTSMATSVPATSTFTPEPTSTPTPEKFFTNEFDRPSEDWSLFSISGENSVLQKDNEGVNTYYEDGQFVFDIERKLLWSYYIYDLFDYKDVQIETTVLNRGTNNNNISMICRYSEEYGWFEFNFTNSGLYYVNHALPRFDGYVSYTEIGKGGSNNIKQGLESNTFTAICNGDTLTVLINDVFEKELDAARFDLTEGKIGISASSFLDLPTKLKFDKIAISQP